MDGDGSAIGTALGERLPPPVRKAGPAAVAFAAVCREATVGAVAAVAVHSHRLKGSDERAACAVQAGFGLVEAGMTAMLADPQGDVDKLLNALIEKAMLTFRRAQVAAQAVRARG